MIICCVIMLSVSLLSEYLTYTFYFSAAALCIVLALYMRKNKTAVLAFAVLLIYFLSAAFTDLLLIAPCRQYDEISVIAKGVVTQKTSSDDKDGVVLRITECEKIPKGSNVFISIDKNSVSTGDTAVINCRLYKTKSNMYSRGIILSGNGKVENTIKTKYGIYRFSESIKQYIERTVKTFCNDSSLSLTMLTSDKNYMDYEDVTAARNSGVSHIIVVSGMHMVVICSSVGFLLSFLKVKKKYSVPLLILLVFTVCTVCGYTPSVLRAAIGYTVYLLVPYTKKRISGIDSLCFACVFMLVLHPFTALDVGFMLSFSSTFGILVISPKLLKRAENVNNRFLTAIYGLITTSLGAYIAVLPVCIINFGYISIVGLAANILLSYAVEVLLIASLLLLATATVNVLDGLCLFFGRIADIVTVYFYAVTRFFASLPFSVINFRSEKLLGTIVLIAFLLYYACKESDILLKLKRGEKYDLRLGRNT